VADIGTLEWARRTGGRIGVGDRFRLLAEGLRFQIAAMAPSRRRRAGLDREALSAVELPERPPDSAVAREAEELCRELSSETLLNHCLRTYVWGCLIGQRDGLRWDEELLYVCSMLHDLGLTDAHFRQDPSAHCFAVEGGRAAAEFGAGRGWEAERRDRLAEAICLHINVFVGPEHGAEAHLLFRGAGYDVIGRDLHAIDRPTRDRVHERHPRLGMKREFGRLMRRESDERPRSRARLYCRYGGFLRMIERAPFPE
jgi:hypothetical protein